MVKIFSRGREMEVGGDDRRVVNTKNVLLKTQNMA